MNYHWGNKVALRLGPGSHFNRIENNRFEQSIETGIMIGDPKGGDPNQFNIITGNTIHTNSAGNSGKFNAVEAHDAHAFTFTNNQIFSWSSDSVKVKSGLVLGRCVKWIIKDNIIRHYTAEPIVYDPEERAYREGQYRGPVKMQARHLLSIRLDNRSRSRDQNSGVDGRQWA